MERYIRHILGIPPVTPAERPLSHLREDPLSPLPNAPVVPEGYICDTRKTRASSVSSARGVALTREDHPQRCERERPSPEKTTHGVAARSTLASAWSRNFHCSEPVEKSTSVFILTK
eukprot:9475718-Pyramimonas_sp.AAC.1